MRLSKRILLYLATGIVVLAILYIAFYFVFLDLIVDYWWFDSLEYTGYFWLRLLYKYFILGAVTLFFFGIFFFHFWIASQFLGVDESFAENTLDSSRSQRLLSKFQTGALGVYTPMSLIMSIIIAIPFYHHWEEVLLYVFAPKTGIEDPFYGYDVSFYMFSYPIYQIIQKELLSIAVLLFLAIAFLYWRMQLLFAPKKRDYPMGVWIHLAVLGGFVCLFVVWGFLLERFGLLFFENHEPVFFGPGFVEIRYHLPLIWLAIVTFLLSVGFVAQLFYTHGKKGRIGLIFSGGCFVLALGFRMVNFFPDLLEKFIVQPNPVKAERTFMANNITATLRAYDLDRVKTKEFVPSLASLDDIVNWEGKKHLDNVPLWDRELLKDAYFQLQGLRPYYNFITVDEDRYVIDGTLKQINLSARELNIERLPKEAQTWENKHLRYTHGYGAVMTPAAQAGGQPQNWYLRDLKLHSKVGFQVENPDIYYGMEDYPYAIIPNKLQVVGIAGGVVGSSSQHSGDGGIPVKSLFRKMLLAFYLKDEKVFFSINLSDDSRVRIRRNIIDRIEKLTPFLSLDGDPYLVVAPDGFYWIQDAYTTSDWYPVSKRSTAQFRTYGRIEDKQFNYIRNPVKIIVNAYDGTTNFHIVDSDDPIIEGYNRAYPGLFKTLEDIPTELSNHLRYPRDMYYQQMKIYVRYHQVEPELFYQQAETWEFPAIGSDQMKPYFLTTDMQGCEDMHNFVLMSLMTPVSRDNLSGFAVAGTLDPDQCGSSYSPSIVMLKVRKDIQLDGPAQISALIDQDPVISEQLTLWDQHGSTVVRGRMILLPVGNSVLYLQPVYLISTDTKIPELTRVIVASGSEVIMQKTAAGAFKKLEIKLGAEPEPAPKPQPALISRPETPVEQPNKVEEPVKFVITGDVSFDLGKASVNPSIGDRLTEIAQLILKHDDIVVSINGFTDSTGSEAYNQQLSILRAKAVKQWLIEHHRVPADILKARGYGEENPIAGNTLPDGRDNPAGRAKNRRVEIAIEKVKATNH